MFSFESAIIKEVCLGLFRSKGSWLYISLFHESSSKLTDQRRILSSATLLLSTKPLYPITGALTIYLVTFVRDYWPGGDKP